MNVRIQMVINDLKAGKVVHNYREGGNSMTPLIHSRQPVTIEPVDPDCLDKGDIVFCKVRGRFYTHLVWAVRGDEVQIGNNHNHSNGWTKKSNVFGIITEVEGREIGGARQKVQCRREET